MTACSVQTLQMKNRQTHINSVHAGIYTSTCLHMDITITCVCMHILHMQGLRDTVILHSVTQCDDGASEGKGTGIKTMRKQKQINACH